MTKEVEFWSLCNQRREVKEIVKEQQKKLEEIDFQIWQQTRFMEHKSVQRWIKFQWIKVHETLSPEWQAVIYVICLMGPILILLVWAGTAAVG